MTSSRRSPTGRSPTATGEPARCCCHPPRSSGSPTAFCASDLVVQLDPAATTGVIRRRDGTTVSDGQHEPLYTTVELLEVEAEIVARYRNGRHAATGAGHRRRPSTPRRSPASSSATNSTPWCGRGAPADTASRPPSGGPAPARRPRCAPRRRCGTQPATGSSAVPSKVKRPASSPPTPASRPTPSPCCWPAPAAGQRVLDPHTVLIVDEASTIGDRDLLRAVAPGRRRRRRRAPDRRHRPTRLGARRRQLRPPRRARRRRHPGAHRGAPAARPGAAAPGRARPSREDQPGARRTRRRPASSC